MNVVILLVVFHVGYGTTSQQIIVPSESRCEAVASEIQKDFGRGFSFDSVYTKCIPTYVEE